MKNIAHDLSQLEKDVLEVIENAGRPISFREIYNELRKQSFVSESGVDHAIDKLELRGLITRKKIKIDKKGPARLHYTLSDGKQQKIERQLNVVDDPIELLKLMYQDASAYIESCGDVPVYFIMPDGHVITSINELLDAAMLHGAWLMVPSRRHGWSMFAGDNWREIADLFPEAYILFAPGFYVKIPKNMLK